MLAEAKREAERVVKEARDQQARLISDEEVYKQAERAAEEIIEDARETRAPDPPRRGGLRRRDPLHARGQPREVPRRGAPRARPARRPSRGRAGRGRLAASPDLPPHRAPAAGEIRRALPDDAEALGDALARAFADDPGLRPPAARRDATAPSACGSSSRPSFAPSRFRAGSSGRPTTSWAPRCGALRKSGGCRSRRACARAPRCSGAFGRRLPLALWSRLRMDAKHPKRPPHCYLAVMGVAPEWQGHGLGTGSCSRASARSTPPNPAYLDVDTTEPRAVRAKRLRGHRRAEPPARRPAALADVARPG